MSAKTAIYVDWQERATEFKKGDTVVPFGFLESHAARVVAVFPAIGQVDVMFPHGAARFAVEDLQLLKDPDVEAPNTEDVPGGAGTVSVSGGPNPVRIASRYLRKCALYWGAVDRRYRMTRQEREGNKFHCPKCSEAVMTPTIYKRREGASERLLGCPSCLFLIKREDILGG